MAIYGKIRPLLGLAPKPLPLHPRAFSNEEKKRIIGEMLQTQEGRSRLAASMTQPLRTRRDYASIGRKVFTVEPFPGRGGVFEAGNKGGAWAPRGQIRLPVIR